MSRVGASMLAAAADIEVRFIAGGPNLPELC